VLLVVEADVDLLQPAAPLDERGVRAVDHDVGDRRVAHQRLQRTQAEGLVEHLVDQALALAEVQQVGPLQAHLLGGVADLPAELLLAHRAHDGQVHPGDDLLMQLLLVVEELLLGGTLRRGGTGGGTGVDRRPDHGWVPFVRVSDAIRWDPGRSPDRLIPHGGRDPAPIRSVIDLG
jgi:hypothetical protein